MRLYLHMPDKIAIFMDIKGACSVLVHLFLFKLFLQIAKFVTKSTQDGPENSVSRAFYILSVWKFRDFYLHLHYEVTFI